MDQTKHIPAEEEIMNQIDALLKEAEQRSESGDPDGALHRLQEARELCRTFMRENPDRPPDLDLHLHVQELELIAAIAEKLHEGSAPEQSEPYLREFVDLSEACVRKFPSSIECRRLHVNALGNLGAFYGDSGRPDSSMELLRRAIRQLRKIPKEQRNETDLLYQSTIYLNISDIEEPAKALTHTKIALDAALELVRMNDIEYHRVMLQAVRRKYTNRLIDLDQPDKARTVAADMVQLSERMAEENPTPQNSLRLVISLNLYAISLAGTDHEAESIPSLRRGIELADSLSREKSRHRHTALNLLNNMCMILFDTDGATLDDRNRSATLGIRSGRILHRELGPGPWDEVVDILLEEWDT